VRPKGLCQIKIPKTILGIEPVVFRLVAQCLNRLRNRIPHSQYRGKLILYSYRVIKAKIHTANCLMRTFPPMKLEVKAHFVWQKYGYDI